MPIGLELEEAFEALLLELPREDHQSLVHSLSNELLKIGDPVPPELVLRVHSTSLCEDGVTLMRMYDLADGRTGVQCYSDRDPPTSVCYAD